MVDALELYEFLEPFVKGPIYYAIRDKAKRDYVAALSTLTCPSTDIESILAQEYEKGRIHTINSYDPISALLSECRDEIKRREEETKKGA